MKKTFLIIILILISAAFVFIECKQKPELPEKKIAAILVRQVDSFSECCKTLETTIENTTVDDNKLQYLFLNARYSYKKFEWAAEYFDPATSRFVNGPPVEEIELSGQVFEPAGLQVIESFLFPKYDTTEKAALISQLKNLQARCNKYKTHFANVDILNWQVFDATKLEVFRIETLGIAGFDDPFSLKSMTESSTSLTNVAKMLGYYDEKNNQHLQEKFAAATNYLVNHTDFNSFNRAQFIINYCNPITTAITELGKKLHIPVIKYNRLLNQDAKTLFDTNAFNINAYAPDQSSFVSNAKIELGKKLFSDPILSGNETRSCTSCHQPEKAFTDGLAKNISINRKTTVSRNTPTLINAALQAAQFYDMRVNTLEDQSHDVVQSTVEMHGSMKLSVKKLWKDSLYRNMFSVAFPEKNRSGIDTLEVMNAIACYVRSLVFLNSRFDEYMRGNKTAMNNDEVHGFNLFMGKAKCGTCHYMPLFNGTFPPRYMKTEAEVIGVPQSLTTNTIDSDPGRYNLIPVASLKHAFKTPTVRNAARTAPYMHNGIYNSLQQVIDFYNKGGGVGLGMKIDNQTLPFDKLDLTDKEEYDLVAFIQSLNSK